MKIQIRNFGPIESFDFDLEKDFHIIYGKNNIGKSYAITAVYLILKNLVSKDFIEASLIHEEGFLEISESIFKNVHAKIAENKKEFSIKNEITQGVKKILENYLMIKLQKSFNNSFRNLENIQNRLSKKAFSISLYTDEIILNIGINQNGDLVLNKIDIEGDFLIQLAERPYKIEEKDDKLWFILNKNELETSLIELDTDLSFFMLEIADEIFTEAEEIYNDIFFLPASRSGLYEGMNIFSSIFAKLSQMRHLIGEKIEIPALSEPLSDYFLNLSTINLIRTNDIYTQFATEIEEKILDATIQFNNDNKKLEYFNSKTKLKLDLSETSSMVSEIAPIVAYLKYIINEPKKIYRNGNGKRKFHKKNKNEKQKQPSKIIFIEEPEAHLHPEIQVLLIDIFARLTKHKVKIILTTHSNYIFNKFNNLLVSDSIALDKVAAYHMINTPTGSIINTAVQATIDGIEDQNFADTAEKLYRERLDMEQ